MVSIPEALAFISLFSFIALWVRAARKIPSVAKDKWGLYKHRSDKFPDVIRWALRFCLHDGFMVIEARGSRYFIVFHKYISGNGDTGLELAFPDTGWARGHYLDLREMLTANNIPIREVAKTYDGFPTKVHVNCGQEIDKAVDLARHCFFDLFGRSKDTLFRSSPTNYSALYDDVDDPDYVNPSGFRDWWSAWRDREKVRSGLDPAVLYVQMAFLLGFYISYPALWIAWLVTEDTPPAWQWSIGPVQLAGTHSTWILLLVYCVMLVGIFKTNRKLAPFKRVKQKSRLHFLGLVSAVLGLPLAVAASWFGL